MILSRAISRQAFPRPPQAGRFNPTLAQYSNAEPLFGKPAIQFNALVGGGPALFRFGRPNLFPTATENRGQGTVEFWFYATAASVGNRLLYRITEVSTAIAIIVATSNRIQARARFGATTSSTALYNYNVNAWNHVAVTLDDNRFLTFWLNGERKQTIGNGTDILVTSGGSTYGLFGGDFNGLSYRREFRVSRIPRYDKAIATYDVPTGPFVNDADTYMLFHMDGSDENAAGINQLMDDVTVQPPAIAITATGGDIFEYEEGGDFYRSHTFNSTANFEVTGLGSNATFNELDYLIVAGGGGGGGNTAFSNSGGGGGGAGGMIVGTETATINTFTATVGTGGAGVNALGVPADAGINSVFAGQTAIGGGGGICSGSFGSPAGSGGSGGGSRGASTASGEGLQPASASGGFGNNGGTGPDGGGGGGGAAEAGVSIIGTPGGNGGNGLANTFKDGTSTFYAGGGGGGSRLDPVIGLGGLGGGGNGAFNNDGPGPTNGQANTGGGAGGGGSSFAGANGGSGIVIVRYKIPQLAADPDATAFLAAAEITDPTIETAINDLVVGLKAEAIWDKMDAIYPFVGGTSTTHKWNLKNPVDTDAAFRLTFNGGLTHNSNGVTGNGSNAFYNTHIKPLLNLQQNSASGWIYNRAGFGYDFGAIGIGFSGFQFAANFNGSFSARANDNSIIEEAAAALGFFGINRNTSTSYQVWRSFTPQTINVTTTGRADLDLIGLALNAGASGIVVHGTNNHAFTAVGESLTDTQAINLQSLVQTFQTELNRQV